MHNHLVTRREVLGWIAAVPYSFLGQESQVEGLRKLDWILAKGKRESWKALSLGDLVARVGRSFLETPYVGWTLERDADREFCFVSLTGLDCVTLFETSLAIARMIKSNESSPDALIAQVTRTRYRNGRIAGYPSRLHYTADWIWDNDRRGNVDNLTGTIQGATSLNKTIDFMSKHPEVYRQLKAHPELIVEIQKAEERLTNSKLKYVPTQAIAEHLLKTGDIIGIVTSVSGLDCSHTGLIVREGKKARFLHASSVAKKVTLGPPIGEYVRGNAKAIGIMVARPI